MVALRRFQDLMKMLACQSPSSSPSNTTATNKSTQTPDLQLSQVKNSRTFKVMPNQQRRQNLGSPVSLNRNIDQQQQQQERLSQQIKRRNSNNFCDKKRREIYSSDETLQQKHYRNVSSPTINNYIRNRNISSRSNNDNSTRSIAISPALSFRSNYIYSNDINQERCVIKKPIVDNNNYVRSNDRTLNDRALKMLSRNSTIKTPPSKDSKFSRYTPLPAINSCDNNLAIKKTSPELHRRNRRLVRQLTYKVINPLFVKGPLDLQNNLKSPSKSVLFKKSSSHHWTPTLKKTPSRCSTPSSPSSHLIKRSKTIVIKKHKPLPNNSGSGDNNQKDSNSMNSKSLSNQNTSLRNNFYEQKETTEKFIRNDRGKRLAVKKKLIEAAEKIKEGQPVIENAFWVQF